MNTSTSHRIHSLATFTHRALAASALAGTTGLGASFSTNATLQLLGIVAVCSAVPTTLTLNAIASRVSELDIRRPRVTSAARVDQVQRHAA
jgi:hypothetical protein